MIDQLKRSDSGAVHFISGINGNHWILVSLIKERRNNQCYIGYMDSNNTPLASQPDALNCINFIRDNYGNLLLS
ncbi:MAG: hypothetical protein NT124_00240 [Candidatus Dependentiae bacterium]|nr:hypothetical protein [Candidatus Dependentiae bacterium]